MEIKCLCVFDMSKDKGETRKAWRTIIDVGCADLKEEAYIDGLHKWIA